MEPSAPRRSLEHPEQKWSVIDEIKPKLPAKPSILYSLAVSLTLGRKGIMPEFEEADAPAGDRADPLDDP